MPVAVVAGNESYVILVQLSRWRFPVCYMTNFPPLTISLLAQISDRELQSNYLNHIDRTDEVASLLAQIEDKDLALRIINLALEVDLILGSKLTSSAPLDVQAIIVKKIDQLKIPIALKLELWHQTKSKTALPHLQSIFFLKLHYQDAGYDLTESSIAAIIDIDPELAIILLRESQYDSRFSARAVLLLAKIASGEAIELLAGLLDKPYFTSDWDGKHLAMQALGEIGTDKAINKIREFLEDRCHWSESAYIHGLGIVAESAMVDHLVYLLSQPEDTDDLCSDAIKALECVGEKMFDCLHRALYWLKFDEDRCYVFHEILEILFKWDHERTMISLEGAIQSYDPVVRGRAAMVLSSSHIFITDRNVVALLSALNSPEQEAQLEIACYIREIFDRMLNGISYDKADISPELVTQAILETKPILIKNAHHPNQEIRRRVIHKLFDSEPDEHEVISHLLDSGISLTYLENDTVEVRAVAKISKTCGESALPVLLQLIDDPDLKIREAAVQGIVGLGSAEILPILMELAASNELVTCLISELGDLARHDPQTSVFDIFHCNQDITLKFLETAERTMVENVRNRKSFGRAGIFDLGKIGDELAIIALKEVLAANDDYDNVDDAVHSLAQIGTDSAVSALLSVLPGTGIMFGWISSQLSRRGRLGIVPQLWLIQQQMYCFRIADSLNHIQQRENLYNPDFSDIPIHHNFQPDYPRLRDVLLGDINDSSKQILHKY
jgi:HEAT repeat protein